MRSTAKSFGRWSGDPVYLSSVAVKNHLSGKIIKSPSNRWSDAESSKTSLNPRIRGSSPSPSLSLSVCSQIGFLCTTSEDNFVGDPFQRRFASIRSQPAAVRYNPPEMPTHNPQAFWILLNLNSTPQNFLCESTPTRPPISVLTLQVIRIKFIGHSFCGLLWNIMAKRTE